MKKKKCLFTLAVLITMCTLAGCGASWKRAQKNFTSDLNGGLIREAIVYDACGNVIYYHTGTYDIDYTSERLLYDDDQNLRHAVYFKNGMVVTNEISFDEIDEGRLPYVKMDEASARAREVRLALERARYLQEKQDYEAMYGTGTEEAQETEEMP